MLNRATVILAFLMCQGVTCAQVEKVWTLDDCIQYAMRRNIDVRKQSLSKSKSELSLQESKWAFVPSLSASSTYTMSTGRVLDPTTYQFMETSYTGNSSVSISGDITLFEGGRKIQNLKKAKVSLKMAHLKEESVKYNLKLNVIAAYMDVLCAQEQLHIAQQTASLVESQLERSRILFSAGSITESDVLQLQSQLFAAQNDVASARRSEKMARLTLCDLLEMDDYESFVTSEPEIPAELSWLLDAEEILRNHPDYQLSVLNQRIAEYDCKIAKAAIWPALSISVGYGSTFSDARKKVIQNQDGTIRYDAYSFFQQYSDNASAYVSIGLQIPILTGLTVRNGIKHAQLAAAEAEFAMLETKRQTRKQILQSQIDCQAAEEAYLRTLEEVRYAEESQRQINEKYNLGAADYLSWNTALVELAKAQYNMSEQKYIFLLKLKILHVMQDRY